MNQVKRKEGISLVALVITIIVLIILTGTVIATFMEGGIIDRAKEAVKRSDYTTLREAYDTNYNTMKIEIETGIGGKVVPIEVLKKAVREVGMDKEFEFVKYEIIEGVTYKGENEEISQWLVEILSDVEEDELILANGYLTNVDFGDLEERIEAQFGDEYSLEGEGTGAKVKDGNGKEVATVIRYGDTRINVDSEVSNSDSINIGTLLNNSAQYGETEIIAMDINHDGYITYADSTAILQHTAEQEYINQKSVANTNIQIINNKVIMEGISKLKKVNKFYIEKIVDEELEEVYEYNILELNEEITNWELRDMFIPYMKEIINSTITFNTENQITNTGSDIHIQINGFSFYIRYNI